MSAKDIDRQLEELREESRERLERMTRRGSMVMLIFGIIFAALFMYIFYLSPRRTIDIVVVIIAIVGSVAMFTVGLKRTMG